MVTPLLNQSEAIARLCRDYEVSRLEAFGSVTGPDFDPQRSDIDLLVDLPDDWDAGPWLKRYFDLRDDFELLFERPVDLVMSSSRSLKNRFFLPEVNRSRMVLYVATDAETAR